MRKMLAVLALAFLALASGVVAADLQTPAQVVKDRSPEEMLAKIFNSKQPGCDRTRATTRSTSTV